MPISPDYLHEIHGNMSAGNISDQSLPSGYELSSMIVVAVVVSLIMLMIVIGNLLVVVAIATDRNLKMIQNWFIASLAVADSLLGLVIMPFSLANELMGYWYFGPVWCDLWKAIDVLLCTASIMNICLISLDRYWSITRALEYSQKRTPKRAILMITAVWVLSMIICVPPLIGWKNPLPVTDYPLCLLSDELGYIIYSTMGSFYIPAVIMVVVYYQIYRAAKSRARRHQLKKESKKNRMCEFLKRKKRKKEKKLSVLCNVAVAENRAKIDQTSCDLTSNHSDDETTWPTYQTIENTEVSHTCPSSHNNTQTSQKEKSCEVTKLLTDGTKNCITNKVVVTQKDCADTNGDALGISERVHDIPTHDITFINENIPVSVLKQTNSEVHVSDIDCEETVMESRELSPLRELTSQKSVTVTSDVKTNKCNDAVRELERHKRKLAKTRERRATIVLGLVMAAFIICWLPFFTLYIIKSLCNCIPDVVFNVFFWAGYCNSALNPIIYTVFNREFRNAFHKIVFKNELCRSR